MSLAFYERQPVYSVEPFGMSVKGAETGEGGLETNIRWLEVHQKSFRIPPGVFSVVKDYIERTEHPEEITRREIGTLHASANASAQSSGLSTKDAVEACMNYLGYQREDMDVRPVGMSNRREYRFVKIK